MTETQSLSWHHDSGFNVELTTVCNLACPLCPRTMYAEHVRPVSLSLDLIQQVFTHEFIRQHRRFRFIGNHGDPIFHSEFHAVLRHFKQKGSASLLVNTNGSGRPSEWWGRVAEILDRNDVVLFSIDGLGDTNSIYRVNSKWEEIRAAVQALAGKVKIGWKFIVFSHNQHQIEAAKIQAHQFGFDWISFESSTRWGTEFLSADPQVQKKAAELMPQPSFITPAEADIPHQWTGRYELMNRQTYRLRGAT